MEIARCAQWETNSGYFPGEETRELGRSIYKVVGQRKRESTRAALEVTGCPEKAACAVLSQSGRHECTR